VIPQNQFYSKMALNRWSKLLQKYLFLYKDGFFELPYLSNSPRIMIESLTKTPVNRHNPLVKSISSNNPFCKGIMHYRELEEGFWILAYEIDIKQNIIAKAIYDDNHESDYYFLSFSTFDYEFSLKDNSPKKQILLSTCWTFYKPKTNVSSYFYKGTAGKFYNIIFNKKWVEKNLGTGIIPNADDLQKFLNLETGFLTWLDIAPDAHRISKEIFNILALEKNGVFNTTSLKASTLDLITCFFKSAFEGTRIQKYCSLGHLDYANASRAEKMILQNLSVPFIGIEAIAADVNLSPTKLKVIFKSVFGVSMLQYHKEKNMLLAEQLVKNSDVQIKNIASITGFESASKFSAAFKKRFYKLPSELRNS
jgi:AraC-like DNA-binding protein